MARIKIRTLNKKKKSHHCLMAINSLMSALANLRIPWRRIITQLSDIYFEFRGIPANATRLLQPFSTVGRLARRLLSALSVAVKRAQRPIANESLSFYKQNDIIGCYRRSSRSSLSSPNTVKRTRPYFFIASPRGNICTSYLFLRF